MTTPQQFLELFLRERAASYTETRTRLATVYAKYFGEPLLQHADFFMPKETVRVVVEDLRQLDGVVSAVTCEHVLRSDIRTRYRLLAVGESWKIIGIDRECFMCGRTGQSNGAPSQHCNGEGWHEPKRDAV